MSDMLGWALWRTVAGPLTDLMSKLSGRDGGKWLAALKLFLRGENPWNGRQLYEPWMTLTIGRFATLEALIAEVRAQGHGLDANTEGWLLSQRVPIASKPTEVDLVKVRLRQIDLERSRFPLIRTRLRLAGLELCTAEMVLEARMAFPEQCSKDLVQLISQPDGPEHDKRWLELGFADDDPHIATYVYVDNDSDELTGDHWVICVQPR